MQDGSTTHGSNSLAIKWFCQDVLMQIYANNHTDKAVLKRGKTHSLDFSFSWL